MDITKMSKTELEALGYQQLKEKIRIEQNLMMIEHQISFREEENKNDSVVNKK